MIHVSIATAISEIDAATEDDIEYGNSDILQYSYDHYVIYHFPAVPGVPVSARWFKDFWSNLTKREKEAFVRLALSD